MAELYTGVTVGGVCEPEGPPGTRAGPPGFKAVIVSRVHGYSDLVVFAGTPETDCAIWVRGYCVARFTLDMDDWAIVRHLYLQPNEPVEVWASKPQTTWTMNGSAMGATGLTVFTPAGLPKLATAAPAPATQPAAPEPASPKAKR